MIDDDVITRLVELHDHIKVPHTPPGGTCCAGSACSAAAGQWSSEPLQLPGSL
jgi:hypothetical protein